MRNTLQHTNLSPPPGLPQEVLHVPGVQAAARLDAVLRRVRDEGDLLQALLRQELRTQGTTLPQTATQVADVICHLLN